MTEALNKPDTRTRAQQNRAIRQEELRQNLAAGGHLELAIDLANKLSDVTANKDLDVPRAKAAFDARMKLINKYMPELKATELSTANDTPLIVTQMVFPEK